MKNKRLVIIDILFLIMHLFWVFPEIIIKASNLSEPFYVFMAEAHTASLFYTFPVFTNFMGILDLILMIVNVRLFIRILRGQEDKDKSFPIIAIYAIFSGLSYLSILLCLITKSHFIVMP